MARTKDEINQTREKIVIAIRYYWDEYGYPPSIRDLCNLVPGPVSGKAMSTSAMNYHLSVLEEEERITRAKLGKRVSRTIRLLER